MIRLHPFAGPARPQRPPRRSRRPSTSSSTSSSSSLARLARGAALALAVAAAAAPAAAQDAPLGADLRGLLDHARAQSAELAAMRLDADAAAQRVRSAGALPDPVLRVELMNINNYGMERSTTSILPSKVGETRYTFMQMLPLWGKRGLRADAAAADARQAGARADAAWLELAARVKAVYAEYWRAAGNERLATDVLGLMSRLEQLARSRYAGGLATQADVLRAQVEQTTMRTELVMIENDKRMLRARLNGLLARDNADPLAEPKGLRPLPPLTVADAPALVERAQRAHPLLVAEAARVDAARSKRELTLRERYPDLQVGVVPSQMGSKITTWGLMFEVNVPLQQGSRRAMEHEAEAMVGAALAKQRAVEHELQHEISGNLAAFEAARRLSALLGGEVLPQSELSLQSALAAYENGKAEFSMLLETQRQISKARQELLKSEVEAQLRLADIERLVGEDL